MKRMIQIATLETSLKGSYYKIHLQQRPYAEREFKKKSPVYIYNTQNGYESI